MSYSRKDAPIVRQIVEALRVQGLSVWTDESLAAGADWNAGIEDALRESHVFVFVVSPNSLKSPWVNFELGVALGRAADSHDVRIIPIMVEHVDQKVLPPPLRSLHIVQAEHKSPDEVAASLIEVLDDGRHAA